MEGFIFFLAAGAKDGLCLKHTSCVYCPNSRGVSTTSGSGSAWRKLEQDSQPSSEIPAIQNELSWTRWRFSNRRAGLRIHWAPLAAHLRGCAGC